MIGYWHIVCLYKMYTYIGIYLIDMYGSAPLFILNTVIHTNDYLLCTHRKCLILNPLNVYLVICMEPKTVEYV